MTKVKGKRQRGKQGMRAKTIDKELQPRDPRFPVELATADTAQRASGEQLTNISRTGALILTDRPLPVGSIVDFAFPILDDVSIVLEGTGEVVRVQQDPAGMGVTFIMLSDRSFKELNGMLARRADAST